MPFLQPAVPRVPHTVRLATFAFATLTLLGSTSHISAQDVQAVLDSMVRISGTREGSTVRGSGFVIAVDDVGVTVVTASHVIEGAQFEVTFAAGPTQNLVVQEVGLDTENRHGLAVFRVRGTLPASVRPLDFSLERPSPNQSVTLVGYPQMSPNPLILSRGYAGQKGLLYTLDQNVGEGFSGGPVLVQGQVIGMVTGTEGDFSYAIPSTVIREFVIGWGLSLPDATRPELDRPSEGPTSPSTGSLVSRTAAEMFARDYPSLLLRGRIDDLIRASSVPFYLNGEFLTSLEELRFRYERADRSGKPPSPDTVDSGAMEVSEFRARMARSSVLAQFDDISRQLGLGSRDIVVVLSVRAVELSSYRTCFMFRRTGSRFTMAGLWDWSEPPVKN